MFNRDDASMCTFFLITDLLFYLAPVLDLLGRLVYVREDWEAKPRLSNPSRGGGFPEALELVEAVMYSMEAVPLVISSTSRKYLPNRDHVANKHIMITDIKFSFPYLSVGSTSRICFVNLVSILHGSLASSLSSTNFIVRTRANHSSSTAQAGNTVGATSNLAPMTGPSDRYCIFNNADDARNAIQRFNRYEGQGRTIEVREDRFTSTQSVASVFKGCGAFAGGFGGRGGFGARDRYSRVYGGGGSGYDANLPSIPSNPLTDFDTANGEKGRIIFVRNVSWHSSICHELTASPTRPASLVYIQ
jgi:hypothetical protein